MMQAFEIKSKTDEKGLLKIEVPLKVVNRRVKIIVLLAEDEEISYEDISDEEWLKAMSKNPAFDFLNDPAEDIYTIADAKPWKHEI